VVVCLTAHLAAWGLINQTVTARRLGQPEIWALIITEIAFLLLEISLWLQKKQDSWSHVNVRLVVLINLFLQYCITGCLECCILCWQSSDCLWLSGSHHQVVEHSCPMQVHYSRGWTFWLGFLREILTQHCPANHRVLWMGQVCQGTLTTTTTIINNNNFYMFMHIIRPRFRFSVVDRGSEMLQNWSCTIFFLISCALSWERRIEDGARHNIAHENKFCWIDFVQLQ